MEGAIFELFWSVFHLVPLYSKSLGQKKAKLLPLESLAKFLEAEELQMKNQDKTTANYAQRFTRKNTKSSSNQPENFQDPEPG